MAYIATLLLEIIMLTCFPIFDWAIKAAIIAILAQESDYLYFSLLRATVSTLAHQQLETSRLGFLDQMLASLAYDYKYSGHHEYLD